LWVTPPLGTSGPALAASTRIEKGEEKVEADVTHTHTHNALKLASSVDETNSASTRRNSDVFRRSHMTFAFVIQS
jgi:hypothetical protein